MLNIKDRFEQYHRGKDNAIKRKRLLMLLKQDIPDIDDREMRLMYESLPVCGDTAGLYFPASETEREQQIELNRKKIRAYAMKIKILKRYRINGEPIQRGLFE